MNTNSGDALTFKVFRTDYKQKWFHEIGIFCKRRYVLESSKGIF